MKAPSETEVRMFALQKALDARPFDTAGSEPESTEVTLERASDFFAFLVGEWTVS